MVAFLLLNKKQGYATSVTFPLYSRTEMGCPRTEVKKIDFCGLDS